MLKVKCVYSVLQQIMGFHNLQFLDLEVILKIQTFLTDNMNKYAIMATIK